MITFGLFAAKRHLDLLAFRHPRLGALWPEHGWRFLENSLDTGRPDPCAPNRRQRRIPNASGVPMAGVFPYCAQGAVVKGFGRGSKDVGVPTANFGQDVVDAMPDQISRGIYFGFAAIDGGPVRPMVMCIGWNPFYNNEKKSMETHIIHKFDDDFYGKQLKVVIVGYLRAEKNFSSLDELKECINNDIKQAEHLLDLPEHSVHKDHDFFTKQS